MAAGVSVRCALERTPGSGYNHTRYDGTRSKAPKRQKCAGCGGRLSSTPTIYAVVDWRADGRYELPGWKCQFSNPDAAQKMADSLHAAIMPGAVVRSFAVAEENTEKV